MVDKIRELCKKNGTSIFKIKKQFGFGISMRDFKFLRDARRYHE